MHKDSKKSGPTNQSRKGRLCVRIQTIFKNKCRLKREVNGNATKIRIVGIQPRTH